LAIIRIPPLLEKALGKLLAGRNEAANGAERLAVDAMVAQQIAVDSGDAEHVVGTMARDGLGDGVAAGPAVVDHERGSDPEPAEQAMTEREGEEQF
jgi:hypothetical protein